MAFHKRRHVARLAVTNGKRDDVASPSAHRCPHPSCASFVQHTTPPLIEFKNVIWRCRQERIFSLRQLLDMGAEPPGNRLSGDVKDALDSQHSATLQAGAEYRLFVGFPRGWLWRENAIRATVLATIPSIPTTIGSVFDETCALTGTAGVRYGFLNHDPNSPSSLTTSPPPESVAMIFESGSALRCTSSARNAKPASRSAWRWPRGISS